MTSGLTGTGQRRPGRDVAGVHRLDRCHRAGRLATCTLAMNYRDFQPMRETWRTPAVDTDIELDSSRKGRIRC